MKNYDLPTVDENMTLAEIATARNRMNLDGRNDAEHPSICARHPEHAAWTEYAGKLAEREVAAEGETKRAEQDAAISDCEDVDPYAEPEAQIKVLELIPGFMDGTLRRSDRARHDRLVAARSALYERAENEKGDDEPDA
ncbi:MAG: hypothetical protein NTY65_01855 [Planctomycetota bacterium]|nr:hypothetical protein [Planctomycetota bacterium]